MYRKRRNSKLNGEYVSDSLHLEPSLGFKSTQWSLILVSMFGVCCSGPPKYKPPPPKKKKNATSANKVRRF